MGTQVYNNLNVGKPIRVERAAANLPQGGAGAIFTVTGKVLICDIVGEVITTAIASGTNNTKLTANPTTLADVDLCATVDIASSAIGSMFHVTGTFSDAMVITTSAAFESQATAFEVSTGTIDLYCSASKTGKVKWVLFYIPLDSGATVVKV
jgi:hypothetical protein